MCLIVIAVSAISAITMIAITAARLICLDAGMGGATTLREYAVLVGGRVLVADRASRSCQRGPRVVLLGRGSYTDRRGRDDGLVARGWGTVP